MIRVLKRERRRAMMNNVLLATSTPFFLAYGDRESPFTVDNGIIAGSTLFWLLGDDVISAWSKNKGAMQGIASVWSYAAPIANGGGLYWYFRNKQNQRFVAGISTVPSDKASFDVAVSGLIGKDSLKDFGSTERPVLATLVDPAANLAVRATLNAATGTLTLGVVRPAGEGAPAATPVKVAWVIDTKGPTEARK
jgi:hypothetical protein